MVEHINVKFNMENIKMALKLLNPGLRPLGTFDLDGADAAAITGGEYVSLAADSAGDGYAADVGDVGPMGVGGGAGLLAPILWNFQLSVRTDGALGGLADEGIAQYGTLFGELIGSNTGAATSESGAVTIGPATNRASGKVTVWHQPGLYGVNGSAATAHATNGIDAMTAVNTAVFGEAATGRLGTTGGDQLGVFCGAVADSSLVSTNRASAGLTNTAVEYYAVYLLSLNPTSP